MSSPAAATKPLAINANGQLVDGAGRVVIMRGINTGGRSKWAPFIPFPVADDADLTTFRAAADTFFGRLHGWGLDTVRLPFSWAALEPEQGEWDEAWLNRYVTMVDSAGDLGLRVVVDFHQDVYAEPFCGDGFPLWTLTADERKQTCGNGSMWFIKYFDAMVLVAFDRFYTDKADQLQAFEAMWARMAGRLKDHPAVVGFEIINEPGGFPSTDGVGKWKKEVLLPFHQRLLSHMKKVAPNRLIFFDNPGVDALFDPVLHLRPTGQDVVYAPHVYDIGLIAGAKKSNADSIARMEGIDAFARAEKMPVLLGEFGYGAAAQSADKGGPAWLNEVMNYIDGHGWSATLWEYSISEESWNEEDLSVVDADGKERPVLDTYVRPWLRALAGSKADFAWDQSAGRAKASWTSSGGVSEIRIPSRLFDDGPHRVTLEGVGACWHWQADEGVLRVRADAGAAVVLTFQK